MKRHSAVYALWASLLSLVRDVLWVLTGARDKYGMTAAGECPNCGREVATDPEQAIAHKGPRTQCLRMIGNRSASGCCDGTAANNLENPLRSAGMVPANEILRPS